MVKKSKKKKPSKTKILQIAWEHLSREQKDLYVTLLWQDGFSEKAIAELLQTTKGRIVVHRQRVLKLPSKDRPKPRSIATSEHLRDLLDRRQMDEVREQGVEVFGPVSHDYDFLAEPEDKEAVEHKSKEKESSEPAIPSFAEPPFLPAPDSATETRSEAEPVAESPPEQAEELAPEEPRSRTPWQSPSAWYSDMPASAPSTPLRAIPEEETPEFNAEEVYGPFEPTCKWPDASGRICTNKAEWKRGSNFCRVHQLNKRLLRDFE